MKNFHHYPTAKISTFLRVYHHLGLILPKYKKFRIQVLFADGQKKLFLCSASSLLSLLLSYDECLVYVFGLSDGFETLIIEQNLFGVTLFD